MKTRLILLVLALTLAVQPARAKQGAPPMNASTGLRTATFAGGCFWCTEAVFQQLKGVSDVRPGYIGGVKPDPTYEEVCTGRTGHAEAIEFRYDPKVVSFRDLLLVFFKTHDPTTRDRQGNDVGTQYRSAVFFHDPEQKAEAMKVVAELNAGKTLRGPIVTEVTPADVFYVAEEYHWNYFRKHPEQGYCRAVIAPKVDHFRAEFKERIVLPK